MNWIRLGLSPRVLQIRRGRGQPDAAGSAEVSRRLISAIERGRAGDIALATLVKVAAALDARLDVGLRRRDEQLDRLFVAAHARLVKLVVELLVGCGWDVAVEASFTIRGERGSIDVLARHRATGQVLVVEVKSVVPDSQVTLHGVDRKVRLAPAIAAERGWVADAPIARLLVIGDGSTSRRRIAALAAAYDSALPDDGATVRAWLRRPAGPLAGLLVLPYANRGDTRQAATDVTRVRCRRGSPVGTNS